MFKRIKKLENEIKDSKIEIEVLKEKIDVLGHVCGCLVNKDICLNCYEKIKKNLKIK